MQCLYCKEATGVENSNIQFPSQCKNRTDRYGSTKFPVSCSAVLSKTIEIFKILGLLFAMVPCLPQCKVYIKRKIRMWSVQKCNFLISAKTAPTGTGQHVAPYRASNENFQNFGATFYHGTVLAPMQSLY